MFSTSYYTIRLLLPDVWMAHINFRLTDAIFNSQLTSSDSIPTSLSVLPDPENMGVVVGIVFLYRVYKARYEYFRCGGSYLGIPTSS